MHGTTVRDADSSYYKMRAYLLLAMCAVVPRVRQRPHAVMEAVPLVQRPHLQKRDEGRSHPPEPLLQGGREDHLSPHGTLQGQRYCPRQSSRW